MIVVCGLNLSYAGADDGLADSTYSLTTVACCCDDDYGPGAGALDGGYA